jgi:hypothetical protein
MIRPIRPCGAALLLFLSLAACMSVKSPQRRLYVDDILKSAGLLEGTQVEVRGFLRFGDDTQNLWSSKDAYSAVSGHFVPPDSPLWNHCISLSDTKKWRAALHQNDSLDVVVRGRVTRYQRNNGDIAFESCSDVGISVASVTAVK